MPQALYRKYRPKSLEEIVGQDHVTAVLKQSLQADRISHAYLLTGPRGVGKTSIARILAHEINKLTYDGRTHLDIIEIDAASNNGVDDVRDLREKVSTVPVSAKKKVYIIDEVHMLSKPAFNALLKTLEEPPEHAVFILATTEVHKLPDTIISRTQRFHFRLIEPAVMQKHVASVAKQENIKIDDAAVKLICQRARGSFRDSISLLDQLSTLSKDTITAEMVEKTLGLADEESVTKLMQSLLTTNLKEAMKLLSDLEDSGVSPVVLAQQLSETVKSHIADQPELIKLAENLIDVGRSYDPSLKLLAAVATAAHAGRAEPVKHAALQSSNTNVLLSKPPARKSKKIIPGKKPPQTLDWAEVLTYVRQNQPVLYGFLQKAQASYENSVLTLHVTYQLHRQKLESGRYRQLLSQAIVALYKDAPDIVITSGKKPPANQQAAAVAALMGGGEEVVASL